MVVETAAVEKAQGFSELDFVPPVLLSVRLSMEETNAHSDKHCFGWSAHVVSMCATSFATARHLQREEASMDTDSRALS